MRCHSFEVEVRACSMVQLNPVAERSGEVELQITDYRLPNGSIKVERRWGQRHPQGANLGSNGRLKLIAETQDGCHQPNPKPLPAHVSQASPFRPAIC